MRKFVDLQVCSVNIGTLRGRSREIVQMLEFRLVGKTTAVYKRLSLGESQNEHISSTL